MKYSRTELKRLYKEFSSLTSVRDKFSFWEMSLKIRYTEFLSMANWYTRTIDESEKAAKLFEFRFLPKKNEVFDYNSLIIAEEEMFDETNGRRKIMNKQWLVSKLKEDLLSIPNRMAFIENLIATIDSDIREKKRFEAGNSADLRPRFFLQGFSDCYFHNKEVDLAVFYDYPHLIEILNGNATAEFRKYLADEINSSSPKKVASRHDITIDQQILLLQFLDVFEKINKISTVTKKAEFLSALLGRNIQTIRDVYKEGIHSFLTFEERKKRHNIVKDLTEVHRLLEIISLNAEAKAVKQEIDKLQKL